VACEKNYDECGLADSAYQPAGVHRLWAALSLFACTAYGSCSNFNDNFDAGAPWVSCDNRRVILPHVLNEEAYIVPNQPGYLYAVLLLLLLLLLLLAQKTAELDETERLDGKA
jgi:hypothetical protein